MSVRNTHINDMGPYCKDCGDLQTLLTPSKDVWDAIVMGELLDILDNNQGQATEVFKILDRERKRGRDDER